MNGLGILSLAAAVSFVHSALAADWPQWRGPKRDGHSPETGLLKEWPEGGPKLAWKATSLGVGYSSVAIASGWIFTMGDGPDSSFVHGMKIGSTKPDWSAQVGKPGGNYAGTRCTPTVDGEMVYALGQFGDVVCVEAGTGKERWRANLKRLGGKMMSGWNYSESLLVDGDKVLATPGGEKGTIVAFNKQTGAVLWQTKEFRDSAAYASLMVANFGGERQYVQLTGASVAGIAANDGRVLWRASRRGETAVIPTPIVREPYVFVTSGYGVGCNLFEIKRDGEEFKAQQVYANKNMVNHHGGGVLVGEHLYGYSDGKGWACQEFKTGNLVWSEKKLGKGSIAYADGHLYLRAEGAKGTVVLIEATREGWRERGRFDQPDRTDKNSWPHPAIADGKLYLRDQDILLCYDIRGK